MTKSLGKSKMGLQRATSIVPYLTPGEVYQMAEAAAEARKGEREEICFRDEARRWVPILLNS